MSSLEVKTDFKIGHFSKNRVKFFHDKWRLYDIQQFFIQPEPELNPLSKRPVIVKGSIFYTFFNVRSFSLGKIVKNVVKW